MVPKSKFNVGDEVHVRIDESGNPETYPAVVVGVRWGWRLGEKKEHIYSVQEEGGGVNDDYPEDWLFPRCQEEHGYFDEKSIKQEGYYFFYPRNQKTSCNREKFVYVEQDTIDEKWLHCKLYEGIYIGPMKIPAKPRKISLKNEK